MPISIGIDFDNTIICYDKVFFQAARNKKLVPDGISPDKSAIRNFLRNTGNEEAWTELQGMVYSIYITKAMPFAGVMEFIKFCKNNNITVFIISHKTLYPYKGPHYNLHEAAASWLDSRGIINTHNGLIPSENVFFEQAKELKLQRIAMTGCHYFIDDLPEFLSEPDFPVNVKRILFDPNSNHADVSNYQHMTSWADINRFFRIVLENLGTGINLK